MKEQKPGAINQINELLRTTEQKLLQQILDEIFNPKTSKEGLKAIHTVINFIKREEVTNINLCFKNNTVKHIIGTLKHVSGRAEIEEYKRRFSDSISYSTRIEGGRVILHNFTFKIAI